MNIIDYISGYTCEDCGSQLVATIPTGEDIDLWCPRCDLHMVTVYKVNPYENN